MTVLPAAIGMPGATELLIIFGIVLLVFGTGKLRSVGRDLGGAIGEFKNSMKSDDKPETTETAAKSEGTAASKTEEQTG